jgi:hypothetical protein
VLNTSGASFTLEQNTQGRTSSLLRGKMPHFLKPLLILFVCFGKFPYCVQKSQIHWTKNFVFTFTAVSFDITLTLFLKKTGFGANYKFCFQIFYSF